MPLRNCSAAHCSGIDKELNDVCKQEGWAVGHPVITRDANGPCQCHCSCLALGTPIAADVNLFKAVEEFSIGDSVLAAGPDLKWNKVQVAFSNGTTNGVQPYSIFVEYHGGSLIVTADHLFFVHGGKLKRADRLSTNDKLVSSDGKPVDIYVVTLGTYIGGFHHIATSVQDPKGDLSNHLIITNGVVSSDYTVQLFYRDDLAKFPFVDKSSLSEPIVGTLEYQSLHGLSEPALGSRVAQGVVVSSFADPDTKWKLFVPASHSQVYIPPDAVPFISKDEADEIAKRVTLRPLTDPHSREWAEYIVNHHRTFYPNVEYHIDWFNDEINAYAWIQNGRRHVALLGGLIRHPSLDVEGLSLVTAHELGHHYGGAPTYPNSTLSCEGQADYFGVRNIMRRVWFGEYYSTTVVRAITQMASFFGVREPGSNTGAGGCNHPPGACRIHTYNAAFSLTPKPSCAG